jgi:hypothetical protein
LTLIPDEGPLLETLISSAFFFTDVKEWNNNECSEHNYVSSPEHWFLVLILVHIHQKKKIAQEIAAKVASVNGP